MLFIFIVLKILLFLAPAFGVQHLINCICFGVLSCIFHRASEFPCLQTISTYIKIHKLQQPKQSNIYEILHTYIATCSCCRCVTSYVLFNELALQKILFNSDRSNPDRSIASFVHAWNPSASCFETSMIQRCACIVDIRSLRNTLLKNHCDNNLHRRDLVRIGDGFWGVLYSSGLGRTPFGIYCIREYCYAKAKSKEPGC